MKFAIQGVCRWWAGLVLDWRSVNRWTQILLVEKLLQGGQLVGMKMKSLPLRLSEMQRESDERTCACPQQPVIFEYWRFILNYRPERSSGLECLTMINIVLGQEQGGAKETSWDERCSGCHIKPRRVFVAQIVIFFVF